MFGEKLLIKMWETLTEKGIGTLLEPWHKARMSKVELEAKKNEIIVLANAERQALDIKNNHVQLTLTNIDELHSHIESKKKIENIKKEVNISKVILYAEDELKDDTQEPPKDNIDEDWLYKWKNNASEISTEKLQQIWGRLLAGELKSPGKYSLRTLEFLKSISTEEAKLIERIAQFNINGSICRDSNDILENNNILLENLLFLQELGILYSVDTELAMKYSSNNSNNFFNVLISNGKALSLKHKNSEKKADMHIYGLSSLGKEVLSLGSFNHNEEYLISIGKNFKNQGFDVALGDWEQIDKKGGHILNEVQI